MAVLWRIGNRSFLSAFGLPVIIVRCGPAVITDLWRECPDVCTVMPHFLGRISGHMIWLARFVVFGCAILCAGCGTQLFSDAGPNALAVKSGVTWNGPPYGLVKLSPEVVNILDEYGPRTLSALFGDHRPPPEIKFGIGDVIGVTVFEAAAGGLFIPAEAGVRPGNFVTLPNQPIDTKGLLFVPYAGPIQAAGKRPSEVSQEIVDRDQGSGDRTAGSGVVGDPEHLAHYRARRSEQRNDGQPDGPHSGAAGGRTLARRDHPGRRAQGSGTGHLGGARAPWPPGRGSVRFVDL